MADGTITSAARLATPSSPCTASMEPEWFIVDAVRADTADTFTLDIHSESGGISSFAPGQFNMLYAPGVGEVPISISGDPADAAKLIHTVRAVGAVSAALAALAPGDRVGVRGPFGSAWPLNAAKDRDLLIVTGGIGLAPLRPAILGALAARDTIGELTLLYGARTPEDMLYPDQLNAWSESGKMRVETTVDSASGAWQGRVGVVPSLIPSVDIKPERTVAFVCGPEIMMRFTIQALVDAGMPHSSIYISMERNMQCGVGQCGHCQLGPFFVCKDGPVFDYETIRPWLEVREL